MIHPRFCECEKCSDKSPKYKKIDHSVDKRHINNDLNKRNYWKESLTDVEIIESLNDEVKKLRKHIANLETVANTYKDRYEKLSNTNISLLDQLDKTRKELSELKIKIKQNRFTGLEINE